PRELALPFAGSLDNFASNGDSSGVTFEMSGWLQNVRYFSVRGGRLSPLGVEAPTYAGVSNFEVINEQAVSHDGTGIPLFILAPKGLARDHNAPTIVYGYASYGVSQTPGYAPNVYAWLEQGGVFAFCAARGGGERGRAWHEGGRESNKPNAHADFDACGHRLIDLGFTNPARLGATGVSAGGPAAPACGVEGAASVRRCRAARVDPQSDTPQRRRKWPQPVCGDGRPDDATWLSRALRARLVSVAHARER